MATASYSTILASLISVWVLHQLWKVFYNYALHPLRKFPGPASTATGWFKCYQEVFLQRNWTDVLKELHRDYGDVVRVGPNEVSSAHQTRGC